MVSSRGIICQVSPVHKLDAVVEVGHAGHAHGLGQPVPGAQLHVEEVPELCRVTRLSDATILITNIVEHK